MTTIITNENIRYFIRKYTVNKYGLPPDLKNTLIGNWDVSRVTNMRKLFLNCHDFIDDINDWNVSNVKDMSYMFSGCYNFNQPLYKWNVLNVTSENGMEKMFSMCQNFKEDISMWNVSNVKNMSYMFNFCKNFNQDLSSWDVSNVKNMNYMFFFCESLTKKPNWLINERTITDGMFKGTPLAGQSLYTTKEADNHVRTTNELFSDKKFQNIPNEIVRYNIIPFFDPKGQTTEVQTMKRINEEEIKERRERRRVEEPGGGGYAGGRKSRKNINKKRKSRKRRINRK
jgi:surface protein